MAQSLTCACLSSNCLLHRRSLLYWNWNWKLSGGRLHWYSIPNLVDRSLLPLLSFSPATLGLLTCLFELHQQFVGSLGLLSSYSLPISWKEKSSQKMQADVASLWCQFFCLTDSVAYHRFSSCLEILGSACASPWALAGFTLRTQSFAVRSGPGPRYWSQTGWTHLSSWFAVQKSTLVRPATRSTQRKGQSTKRIQIHLGLVQHAQLIAALFFVSWEVGHQDFLR